MLSVIICSVRPSMARQVVCDINQTAHVECEFIVIDNREKQWPIAKAYNHGARQARYPDLLFIHEDVKFRSSNWGHFIEEKLKEPDCGAIGVAGTTVKSAACSGWLQHPAWNVNYHYQRFGERTELAASNHEPGKLFKEVVALDGMVLFVRRELWEKYPFDEYNLPGFHCYDLDFTLQLAHAGYKNHVCCSDRFLIEHFSLGHFSDDWFTTTIALHDGKWKKWLPMATEEGRRRLSAKEGKRSEEKIAYSFLFHILRSNCPEKKRILKEFWQRPFTWNHFKHCIACTIKYWRTKLEA